MSVVEHRPGLGGRGVGRRVAHGQQRVPGLRGLGARTAGQAGPPGRADRPELGRVPRRELARRVHRVGRSGGGREPPDRAAAARPRGPERPGAPQRPAGLRSRRWRSRCPTLPGSPGRAAAPGAAMRSPATGDRRRAPAERPGRAARQPGPDRWARLDSRPRRPVPAPGSRFRRGGRVRRRSRVSRATGAEQPDPGGSAVPCLTWWCPGSRVTVARARDEPGGGSDRPGAGGCRWTCPGSWFPRCTRICPP